MEVWVTRLIWFVVGWFFVEFLMKKFVKAKERKRALAALEVSINFACDPTLWESNEEYNEMFKYRGLTWYQVGLRTTWESYKKNL